MKKSILITIVALTISGAYFKANAEYFDECGIRNLRQAFDGTSRTGPREDSFVGRPSVRPDAGSYSPPQATASDNKTNGAIVTPQAPKSNKASNDESAEVRNLEKLANTSAIIAFAGGFGLVDSAAVLDITMAAAAPSGIVLGLVLSGIGVMIVGGLFALSYAMEAHSQENAERYQDRLGRFSDGYK